MMIRLDKWLAQNTRFSRNQVKKMISQGRVMVDMSIVTDLKYKLKADQSVEIDNQSIANIGHQYYVLHKPAGYICSTKDERYPSALNLISSAKKETLHFAGRLDADTTGLVLISDDGQWTHKITSPRRTCGKTYLVYTSEKVSAAQILALGQGVKLKSDDLITQPAQVSQVSDQCLRMVLKEGRYHQVKRMLAAVGNHVVKLHREKVGQIDLTNLNVGEWRTLSEAEINQF